MKTPAVKKVKKKNEKEIKWDIEMWKEYILKILKINSFVRQSS